jgi:hypothetical protein
VGGRGRGKLSPKRLRQRETRLRAIALRRQGLTFAEIAAALGYKDRASCYMSIRYELDKERADAVETLREIEGKRLDAVERAIWPRVISGQDLDAVRVFVAICRRRAMLFGLDARQEAAASMTAQASATVLIQIGQGEAKPLEQLSEAELVAYVKHLQALVDGEERLKMLPEPQQNEQHDGSSPNDDV